MKGRTETLSKINFGPEETMCKVKAKVAAKEFSILKNDFPKDKKKRNLKDKQYLSYCRIQGPKK